MTNLAMFDPSAVDDFLWKYAMFTIRIFIGVVYLVSFWTICSCAAAFRSSTSWKRWGDGVLAVLSVPLAWYLFLAMCPDHDGWAATYLVSMPCFIGIVLGVAYVSVRGLLMLWAEK